MMTAEEQKKLKDKQEKEEEKRRGGLRGLPTGSGRPVAGVWGHPTRGPITSPGIMGFRHWGDGSDGTA